MPNRALNQYKQNSVVTASKEELTMMLYNGAIKFMNIGKVGIEEKDIQKKNNALIRAQDIINELKYSLNMDFEISKEMVVLYDFILQRLVDGNIGNDIRAIEDAQEIVYEMRETWKDVMVESKKLASRVGE